MNQDIRALLRRPGAAELLAGLGAAESAMWASPKPKFKPAVWRFAEAKRRSPARRVRPGRAGRAPQPDHGQPDRGQHLRHQSQHRRRLPDGEGGRRARSHRHTAAALRLVVQAKPGTYTVVDGARVDMLPGDVVLTPSWCWHGHANESDETSYWIDFLDVPFVQHSEAMFFEPTPGRLRDDHQHRPAATDPRARSAWGRQRRQGRGDRQGALPTIGLHLCGCRAARAGLPKTTVNHLYSVIPGKARVESTAAWTRKPRGRRRDHRAVLARAYDRGRGRCDLCSG